MYADGFGEALRVIAPFEDADDPAAGVGFCDGKHAASQTGEVFGFELERPDGIIFVGVEAGADQDELRPHFRGNGFEGAVKSSVIVFELSAILDRLVERVSEAFAFARFVFIARAGIKRPAVDGEKTNLFVFPEHCLSAIPMMDIPVDDQDAVERVLGEGGLGADGDVAKEAKTHGVGGQGVMARRPNEADSRFVFALGNTGDGIANGAGGVQGDVVRPLADDGVDLDLSAARRGKFLDAFNVFARVNPLELLHAGGRPFGPHAASSETCFLQMLVDNRQPQRPFRMSTGLMGLEEAVGIKESHVMKPGSGKRIGLTLANVSHAR